MRDNVKLAAAAFESFLRLFWCKVVIENPGEGTNDTTVQEEIARRSENESEDRANYTNTKLYKYKRDLAFVFYDFEMRQNEMWKNRKCTNLCSDSLRSATNLRNMCGDREYVGAMLLVQSARVYISKWSG